ncbi:MAG: hypothetical protein JWP29_4837 [Rhodoferax sp.]|nr:hypothetical protein [Rhodoferax sp.]
MTQATDIVLSDAELEAITGYKTASKQLQVLQQRGFNRAFLGRYRLILERAHYEAVCSGAATVAAKEPRVHLPVLKPRKSRP